MSAADELPGTAQHGDRLARGDFAFLQLTKWVNDLEMDTPIPVVCERCGVVGNAGAADFSHLGDLLEFAAVPRQLKRRDGWTPVLQREFIARLAQTGSPTLAVEAMGKCLHGIRKLLKDPGSEGFQAAWERAV
jgi:hypothetical protein